MGLWSTLALTAGLTAAGMAHAQQQPSQTPGEEVSEVDQIDVVGRLRAQQVRDRVDAFIEGNMAPAPGRPLARWSKPVCVGTAQFSAQYGQAVIDRVAQRIIEAGGDVAEPGCKVDVMIVGTDDGAAMAQALVRDDPRGFRPSRNSTDRGSTSLRRFQEGDAPVRWWHVSLPVNVETGEWAVRLDGEDYPVNAVREASRLRTNTRDDLARVVVVVDFSKVSNVRISALIDYLAFVALAQVNPEGLGGEQDTILNLFHNPEGVTGMSQWDVDYLAALYKATPNRPSRHAQARSIADEVVRDREGR